MNDQHHQRRGLRATPEQLKELRTLRVAVIHPDDADGLQLSQQLQRIGCKVQAFWPPIAALPNSFDIVFVAVRPDVLNMNMEWVKRDDGPTIIAVVNYENPTIVDFVLRLGAKAILPSPVRSFGLLSTLVLARESHREGRALSRRLGKLESKLLGLRHISDAKAILMKARNISETEAYDLVRERAMSTRSSTEDVARLIVEAHELLSMGKTL